MPAASRQSPGAATALSGTVTRVEPATALPSLPAIEDRQPDDSNAIAPAHVAVAPRLSIVVLPFANLSDDREQQYFADGITEDLMTDLSRIADTLVISRNTVFTFRDRPVETKQIGRELGVRYVLEGSVRRSDNRLRVNIQLIDALTDAHLWADRFDCEIGDLFALRSEITSRIAVSLSRELVAAAGSQPNEDPDVLVLQGRIANSRPAPYDRYAQAIGLFERALALDPGLSRRKAGRRPHSPPV